MAQLSFIVENAIHHFYDLWSRGLQPSLSLNTQTDGAVCVTSSVISAPSGDCDVQQLVKTFHRRRSGRGARRRRQLKRAQGCTSIAENCATASNELNLLAKSAIEGYESVNALQGEDVLMDIEDVTMDADWNGQNLTFLNSGMTPLPSEEFTLDDTLLSSTPPSTHSSFTLEDYFNLLNESMQCRNQVEECPAEESYREDLDQMKKIIENSFG